MAAASPTLFDMVEEEKPAAAKKARTKAKAKAALKEEKAPPPLVAESGSRRKSAEAMAERQRDISVAEFFTKNRHLLGFDSPLKALLTAVKEAVDNSLDACEEAGILPDILVEIVPVSSPSGEPDDRFRMVVEDNGPGIV